MKINTTQATDNLAEIRDVKLQHLQEGQLYKLILKMEKHEFDRIFNTIEYMAPELICMQSHVIAMEDEKIIGAAGLKPSAFDANHIWVTFVSVDPAHQGRGIGRRLIEEIYDHARATTSKVEPSSFTQEGQRLIHIFDELDARYPETACGFPRRGVLEKPDEAPTIGAMR